MLRLLVVVAIGLVVAVGATVVTVNMLSEAANGTPSNSSLYQYGSR